MTDNHPTEQSEDSMPNDRSELRSADFATLVSTIRRVHEQCARHAKQAVNVSLTVRNWAIGAYISEYELHGKDRAKYGERLVDSLAEELKRHRVPTCGRQRLYAYIAFFRAYPQIGVAMQDNSVVPEPPSIVRSLAGQSGKTDEREIVRSPTGQFDLSGHTLLHRLSYTHLELLTALKETLRAFVEEKRRQLADSTEEVGA